MTLLSRSRQIAGMRRFRSPRVQRFSGAAAFLWTRCLRSLHSNPPPCRQMFGAASLFQGDSRPLCRHHDAAIKTLSFDLVAANAAWVRLPKTPSPAREASEVTSVVYAVARPGPERTFRQCGMVCQVFLSRDPENC
jgi:hypothetical protein